MIKHCKKHGETRHVKRVDGYYRCAKCSSESVTRRRKKLKVMAVEYMGGSCKKCGYDKCIEALEFHHLDENSKDFSISGSNKSWKTIQKELDKCVLLCANCHREEHSK